MNKDETTVWVAEWTTGFQLLKWKVEKMELKKRVMKNATVTLIHQLK